MKILLLTRYGSLGASSRVRLIQYIPYLKTEGIDVTCNPLLGDDYIQDLYTDKRKDARSIFQSYLMRMGYLFKSRRFDLLWIEKELFPWLPAWAEDLLDRLNIPYIVDYDDPVFHNYDLHPNWLARTLFKRKIDRVMRGAALVIVGNEYLGERALKAGARRVEYLPSVIALEKYNRILKADSGIFAVGWIGIPLTQKYVQFIIPALTEVCKNVNTRLVLVGSGEFKSNDLPVEIRTWSEETEVADIQSFDVGIMPLRDDSWERGKCGYKLIQYMACGLPVVASPVGINKRIVEDGVNGFLAITEQDWVRALKTLREDCVLRDLMGSAGREKVEKQYCLQVTAPRLISLLRSAVR